MEKKIQKERAVAVRRFIQGDVCITAETEVMQTSHNGQ